MGFTAAEVLEFVQEHDIRFIRLAFCDLFGVEKNISIMSHQLSEAFDRGVCVDTSAVPAFVNDNDADIFLYPDPSTLSILPGRPTHGGALRLLCNMRWADGSPYEGDPRSLLHSAVDKAAALGYKCQIGCECEFYLFELDERGQPTYTPQDQAGYCDIPPLDKGEGVRRSICRALEEMGIPVESSHHERGPGQNEVCCKYSGAMEAADAVVTWRAVTELTAAQNGLKACFQPKPLADKDGSSIHINLSLAKDGTNLFQSGGEVHSPEAESFMAGILHHLPDLTFFLNPMPSSYLRIGADVPRQMTWSHQNRNQIVRIPAARGEFSRMELRSPDPELSPYLAFALLLEAGLWGVQQKLELQKDVPARQAPLLPADLGEALERARKNDLVKQVMPQRALDKYCRLKEAEFRRWKSKQD